MNPALFYEIAYGSHHFANPIWPETLDRVLEPAGLQPGGRAADLGCGGGAMAVHLADRYGLGVDAVDMSPAMLAHAAERVRARPHVRGAVTLHQARAEDFLSGGPQPYDLITVVGATELVTAAGSRAEFLSAVRKHLKPGGSVLYGDLFWKREPSEALRAVSAPYGAYADYVRAGAEVGLEPWCGTESSPAEWDDYAWRMVRSVRSWVRSNPHSPAAPALEAQMRFMLESYLTEAREGMGFGLFLFRAP